MARSGSSSWLSRIMVSRPERASRGFDLEDLYEGLNEAFENMELSPWNDCVHLLGRLQGT
jgi:hypothetical protein